MNLDDIAGFIREGRDVQVVDAKTGQDLTRVTLTQIITEDAKEKPTGLPLELLRQLIVASDEVRQEFVMWYLKSAFDTYQKVQDAVQSRLGEVQSAILSPVDMMKQVPGRVGAIPAASPRRNRNSMPCASEWRNWRPGSKRPALEKRRLTAGRAREGYNPQRANFRRCAHGLGCGDAGRTQDEIAAQTEQDHGFIEGAESEAALTGRSASRHFAVDGSAVCG